MAEAGAVSWHLRQVCVQVGTVLLPGPCKSKWSFADYSYLNVNCFSGIYTQAHDNYSEKFLVTLVWRVGVGGKGRGEKRALREREEEGEAGVSLVLSTLSSLLSAREPPSVSQTDGPAQPLSPRQSQTPQFYFASLRMRMPEKRTLETISL